MMKLLVVDDVGYVRHYLDRLLTQHGHTVVTASSGDEALAILKQDNTLNAVVTDLMMPGMDGIELFKAARQIGRFNDAGQLPPLEFFLLHRAASHFIDAAQRSRPVATGDRHRLRRRDAQAG